MQRARARAVRLIVSSLFLFFLAAWGHADSQEVYRLPELPVSAYRLPTSLGSATGFTETLSALAVEDRHATTLGNLLDGLTGLRVSHYGPFGALETVQSFGLNSGHTALFLDGVPLNSPQNGLADLSLQSGLELERVELASGGLSALYGSDAAGAVILLTSRPLCGTSVGVAGEAGSFGSYGLRLSAEAVGSLGGLGLSAERLVAQNDYPYRYPRFGNRPVPPEIQRVEHVRQNADADRVLWSLRWSPPRSWGAWSLRLNGGSREIGVPGAATGAPPAPDAPGARQFDQEAALSMSGRQAVGAVEIRPSGYLRRLRMRYRDPRIGVDSEHRLFGGAFRTELRIPTPTGALLVGEELERWSVESTELSPSDRTRVALFVLLRSELVRRGFRLVVEPALRWDRSSDFGAAWSPRVGLSWGLSSLGGFLQASRSFKAPSFNDLYWRPGGNPLLRPERAIVLEGGFRWTVRGLQGEAAFRRVRLHDQIRWLPDATGTWWASNLDRAEVSGWLLRLEWRSGRFGAVLRGARLRAVQRSGPFAGRLAPFAPNWTASGELSGSWGRFRLFLMGRATGEMPIRPDGRETLGGYFVLDAGARLPWENGAFSGTVQLTVRNLFDREYEVVPQYPMPGRSWELTLSGRWEKTPSSSTEKGEDPHGSSES